MGHGPVVTDPDVIDLPANDPARRW